MMNNPFVVQQAEQWAAQLLAETYPNDKSRVIRLYETALGRPPDMKELRSALEFVSIQSSNTNDAASVRSWADLCHVLYNAKEFVYIR